MATSKDVAKLAGVSIATVSRTFTKRNTVSERTAQRVLDAAKKLDYTPDNIARSLKSNKTNTIGLVISNIYNPFFFQTASVMAKELEKYNFVRIHRSYIVNLKYVNKVLSTEVTVGSAILPVSRNYKEKLKEEYLKYIRGED